MLKRVFAHFKSIGDLVSVPEKLKPIVLLIVLGTISIGGYSIEVSLAGKIFFAVLLAMMWAVTLYCYERWRQMRPPNYDKARGRALLDAALALDREWSPFRRKRGNSDQILRLLNELKVAADPFKWDQKINGMVVKVRADAVRRLEAEGEFGQVDDPDHKKELAAGDAFKDAMDDLTYSLRWANEQ